MKFLELVIHLESYIGQKIQWSVNIDAVYLCKLLQYSYKHGYGPCNNVTGIRCHSRFLDDLNGENRSRFEASKRIYTIYSETDEIVGFKDCDGKYVSEIKGQDHTLKVRIE
uniref:Uncharacterized protein n=1 Tax=Meloidogyne javanica TaxID=6303 RepID=A0A915M0Y7_MELJA